MAKNTNKIPAESLAWLADAPLFSDKQQIKEFYDAVVRPESAQGKMTLSLSKLEASTTTLSGEIAGKIGVAKWLKTIFPFLDAEVSAEVGAERETEKAETKGETVELLPIETPQRQLIQLSLHYAVTIPHRMKVITDPLDRDWRDPEFIRGLPRALVFIDFPKETRFIPMAAETANGQITEIFDVLKNMLSEGTRYRGPRVPMDRDYKTKKEVNDAWDEYWNWYSKEFDSRIAMKSIEAVTSNGNGRIRWIDYRVPLDPSSKPLHLHICGREKFDTGVFAYNLVKRGFSHGLRVVGTLKSDSMNVLAIFEK